MARLPKPGQDADIWGNVLNDFLSVELNADGTLKKASDIAAAAPNDSVVHNFSDETIAGVKTFSSAPVVPASSFPESAVANLTTDLSAKIDRATVTTKGDILAATAASTIARVGVGADGQILTADSTQTSGLKWATPAAAPVTSVVGQTGIITGAQIAEDVALTSTYAPFRERTTAETILIGDSIDSGSGLTSWWNNLCQISNQRMTLRWNAGVGGQNTTQFLARFATDVVTLAPDHVVISGPTNDIQNTFAGGPLTTGATTRANYQAMADLARSAGIDVSVRTCPPADVDVPGGTGLSARLNAIDRHNSWLID